MNNCTVLLRAAGLAALCALLSITSVAAAQVEVLTVMPAFSPFDAPSRTVTVKGLGFTPSTTISFEGVPASSVIFLDSRTLIATVPTVAAPGIATVTVSDAVNGSDQFFPFLHSGPVLYVAATGDDGNSGVDPNEPLRSITAAFAAADAITPTEVRVGEGLYWEADLALWHATILSCGWAPGFGLRDPETHVTEINANRSGFVIRTAGINNVSVIDGCTITGGFRDSFGGGGVVISADSTVVNNNVIVGNSTATIGGGIYWRASTSYGGKPTFSNNVIVGNRAHNRQGGGIVVYPDYNTMPDIRINITGNQIVGNRSFASRGGGISVSTSSYAGYNNLDLKMTDNTLAYNRSRGAGGLDLALLTYGDYFDLTIQNNLVVGNDSLGLGGGMAFQGMGRISGAVGFNTIADNAAPTGMAGGLLIGSAMTLLPGFSASDMILWGNAGGDAQGAAVGAVTYSLSGTTLPGAGNISADPAFKPGERGGYYLTQGDPNATDSPAVNAGSGGAGELCMESLTTCVSSSTDTGEADIGFHYPTAMGDSLDPIAIRRIDPPYGNFDGTDWILIRGDGFDPGATVEFSNTPATNVRFLGNSRLLVQPPPHDMGWVNVRVRNPDTSYADLISGYRYADTEPPLWQTTVGVTHAYWPGDCSRTAVVQWNGAVDPVSPPVTYEIHRAECLPSYEIGIPCDNMGFTPSAANSVGQTMETSFLDLVFPNQDLPYIYVVRARDSADPFNKEWNFGRYVTGNIGYDNYDVTPPDPVGDSLAWLPGSHTELDWAAPLAVRDYGLYRTTDPSLYSDPNTMVKHATLDVATNDANGDGVTDSGTTDLDLPVPGEVFFYKLTAIDPCLNETLYELLP